MVRWLPQTVGEDIVFQTFTTGKAANLSAPLVLEPSPQESNHCICSPRSIFTLVLKANREVMPRKEL